MRLSFGALPFLFVIGSALAAAPSFSPRDFLNLAQRSSSVDSFLRGLPLEMRESYTLQHTPTPNAAQGASYVYPRAILSNRVGDLVVTYNGHASLPGSETIEALTFDPRRGLFDLYRVSYRDGRPSILRNPKMCANCHGAEPHPVWNSYGDWNHMYGSDSDLVDYPAKDEIGALRAFNRALAQGKALPRYSILEPRLLAKLDITPYTGTHFDPQKVPITTDFYFSPNFRLGMFLFRNSSLAIAKRLRKHPIYPELLPLAFLAANCSPGEGKTKEEVWKSNATTFVFPEKGPFVQAHPELAQAYDQAENNVEAILYSQDPRLADSHKFFSFMGTNARRLTMAQNDLSNAELKDLFFSDGLSGHVTRTMAFYPGELLRDLKRIYPRDDVPFVEGRNEKIYHWTTSPEIMDRLDEVTKHALGTGCANLWPLIVRTAASPKVTAYLRNQGLATPKRRTFSAREFRGARKYPRPAPGFRRTGGIRRIGDY